MGSWPALPWLGVLPKCPFVSPPTPRRGYPAKITLIVASELPAHVGVFKGDCGSTELWDRGQNIRLVSKTMFAHANAPCNVWNFKMRAFTETANSAANFHRTVKAVIRLWGALGTIVPGYGPWQTRPLSKPPKSEVETHQVSRVAHVLWYVYSLLHL